jgi:proteasome lid subunit RPN8/RPN11
MVIFPRAQYDAMLSHLSGDRTRERCGLLAGQNGRVENVLPVPNVLRSAVAYRMDGPEFFDALKACAWEPVGIYHSHLSTPPIPSATDIAEATYPEAVYIIVSFQNEPPAMRAYRIVGGSVKEIEVIIE